ncbi:CASP-like protein 1D1 [Zingiber officinale]|uniref:CASP-like protein 1D1 n=1 Tax=Zingiber officinale TaxID=94328 RepID=UPI001C4AD527|nr:CASP-like protein 1D1 [Zingiber officinale]
MASSNTTEAEQAVKTAGKAELPAAAPDLLKAADLGLRLLLFVATLVPLVVTVTSKQTKYIYTFKTVAKFNYSSALIYFVVACSVTCLYSVLTLILSASSMTKPYQPTKLLLFFAAMDALMGGIMASATGAVASIAYIALRGNSHVLWMKVCNQFDKFCTSIGSSVSISLIAAIILVLLVLLSTYSLYLRSHNFS